MGQEIHRLGITASEMKATLLQNNNIDILLYLAKYNPNVTIDDIQKKFGKESVSGIKNLKSAKLLNDDNGKLTLTEQGIFQVEGLLTLAV